MNAVTSAVLFVTAVPTMLLLVDTMGLEGVAIGRLLGSLMFVFLIVWFERKIFSRVDWSFLSMTTLKIFLAALAATAAYNLLNIFIATTWAGLVISVTVAGIVYLAVLLAIKFADTKEMEAIRIPLVERR
jgi:O-antigen/teichoic acid export membrane protein